MKKPLEIRLYRGLSVVLSKERKKSVDYGFFCGIFVSLNTLNSRDPDPDFSNSISLVALFYSM